MDKKKKSKKLNKNPKPNNSNLNGKNLVIDPVNISFGKLIILQDTKLVVEYGQHYGIVGKNGIGKTSLLNAIYNKDLNIPNDLDIIYVKQEEPESNQTVIETLLSNNTELYTKNKRLLELEKIINSNENDVDDPNLVAEYDKLCRFVGNDYVKSQVHAKKILFGLGFDLENQERVISEFSGGWRMRISLAKALFMTPDLLILDEPSNHLDLYANIWLSEYLKSYPKTLFLVSHDKYLIDEVCTIVINICNKKLNYYRGNYEHFQKQLTMENEKIKKDWNLFEKKLVTMRKANKKKEEIDEFIKKSTVTKPEKNYVVKINFLQPAIIKQAYLEMENISFGYNNTNLILQNVNLFIGSKTRMAIVGKNGAGKSTLLKLITGELTQNEGNLIKSSVLRIGYYNQHFENTLPIEMNSVEYLMNLNSSIDITLAHKYLSMFGLEPIHHSTKISGLSGGQKARTKLASFGVIKPYLLLLDEPTNHLDIVATESLINALNNFEGAIVLVTHDFDMITNLNSELWVVQDTKLTKYPKSYQNYIQEVYNECDIE